MITRAEPVRSAPASEISFGNGGKRLWTLLRYRPLVRLFSGAGYQEQRAGHQPADARIGRGFAVPGSAILLAGIMVWPLL